MSRRAMHRRSRVARKEQAPAKPAGAPPAPLGQLEAGTMLRQPGDPWVWVLFSALTPQLHVHPPGGSPRAPRAQAQTAPRAQPHSSRPQPRRSPPSSAPGLGPPPHATSRGAVPRGSPVPAAGLSVQLPPSTDGDRPQPSATCVPAGVFTQQLHPCKHGHDTPADHRAGSTASTVPGTAHPSPGTGRRAPRRCWVAPP